MISVKEYTDSYNRWTKMLQNEARRIRDSAECRKRIMRNIESAPYGELLVDAAKCIADLTGDSVFYQTVKAKVRNDNDR